jgi:hypothetical protein
MNNIHNPDPTARTILPVRVPSRVGDAVTRRTSVERHAVAHAERSA